MAQIARCDPGLAGAIRADPKERDAQTVGRPPWGDVSVLVSGSQEDRRQGRAPLRRLASTACEARQARAQAGPKAARAGHAAGRSGEGRAGAAERPSRSRHGTTIDSTSTARDIFDRPARRSVKTIGHSASSSPACWAR